VGVESRVGDVVGYQVPAGGGAISFMDDQDVATGVAWRDQGCFRNLARRKMLKGLAVDAL